MWSPGPPPSCQESWHWQPWWGWRRQRSSFSFFSLLTENHTIPCFYFYCPLGLVTITAVTKQARNLRRCALKAAKLQHAKLKTLHTWLIPMRKAECGKIEDRPSLKSITLSLWLILTTIRYMMETGQRLLYIAMFVMENGRGWMAVKRQPFAGFVNNQNTLLCKCSWSNDFVSKVSDRSGRRHFK